ncbi:hypothetical protein NW762_014754 [Fusarium torreyae]|uniref:Uncharacterized protein n=1 Tax=Fusarium torreyae TaxID=1237075 RepID=A0A9W8RL21_9HYPO|nr:hypothetical protein NW762_014754 [Fusarium torreyae]
METEWREESFTALAASTTQVLANASRPRVEVHGHHEQVQTVFEDAHLEDREDCEKQARSCHEKLVRRSRKHRNNK